MLKHKIQKIVYKNCGECNQPMSCDYCNAYIIQRDIKDVIYDLLKEEKYDNIVRKFILQIQSKET